MLKVHRGTGTSRFQNVHLQGYGNAWEMCNCFGFGPIIIISDWIRLEKLFRSQIRSWLWVVTRITTMAISLLAVSTFKFVWKFSCGWGRDIKIRAHYTWSETSSRTPVHDLLVICWVIWVLKETHMFVFFSTITNNSLVANVETGRHFKGSVP